MGQQKPPAGRQLRALVGRFRDDLMVSGAVGPVQDLGHVGQRFPVAFTRSFGCRHSRRAIGAENHIASDVIHRFPL
jgi:hypothetical protein